MLRSAQAGAKRRSFSWFSSLKLALGSAQSLFSCHSTTSPIYSLTEAQYIGSFAMDITKWKSVLVPIEVYEQIKTIAKSEGRTISGQLRIMWEVYRDTRTNKVR